MRGMLCFLHAQSGDKQTNLSDLTDLEPKRVRHVDGVVRHIGEEIWPKQHFRIAERVS